MSAFTQGFAAIGIFASRIDAVDSFLSIPQPAAANTHHVPHLLIAIIYYLNQVGGSIVLWNPKESRREVDDGNLCQTLKGFVITATRASIIDHDFF